MQSALLWYKTFKDKLEIMGFKLNPYDPCVANSIIAGAQCTICWYVDDVKISHKDSKVVDQVIRELEKDFGKMTVSRGNKHTYVGMDIELLKDGTVSIQMKDYLDESIKAFGENVKGRSPTPAKTNLFEIDKNSKELSEEKKKGFIIL